MKGGDGARGCAPSCTLNFPHRLRLKRSRFFPAWSARASALLLLLPWLHGGIMGMEPALPRIGRVAWSLGSRGLAPKHGEPESDRVAGVCGSLKTLWGDWGPLKKICC